jgi:hypothetical protein
MAPPQYELPAGWKSPFQPWAGIHTSNLTSEFSIFVVAETRQKAGRSDHGASAAPPRPRGGTNAPAATLWTEVIVALGNDIEARALHAPDAAGGVCA